ncbi:MULTISPECIES: restriction endonuclease [unclassified Herbaspirillum]|uniref:restriction endonuclease n=1 Tax=unclassified Herbaspirillum TaxID=2624150 RepID=UPI000E2E7B92|nr:MULTISPECIES: restriction endonuclease [unclassified Herbaspirillum]RFB68590.1 restriction endonuclease [Herbaspirillum sp. 3R-3a1]TFI05497.1 restriction endonuclease [Herbaspirillum sp. 3R11]TFI13593.1 restriction endonuclease [Herbaspirillum sp. 3R-11]TFI27101.1 restriction endonuclease [Herbaspirillum sp. 3C11]
MAKNDWRDLEQLVAKIQNSLAPQASVEHDAKVWGVDSETYRQIDVLVKQRIGQYEMLIAIDCKDHQTPVDVKGVEEFAGMVADIRANKGVLVCPSGFTQAARTKAGKLQMELYRPVDTDEHKWKVQPTLPALFEFVRAGLAFRIRGTTPAPLVVTDDIGSLLAYSGSGEKLGTAHEIAAKRWNEGEFPTTPGVHEFVPVYPGLEEVQIDNGFGTMVPVSFCVSLHVVRETFFGHIPLDQISGFLDERTGETLTNSFTTGVINLELMYETWERLADGMLPPIKPVLTVRGLQEW